MHQLRPLAFAAALAFVVGCDQAPTSPDASDVTSVESSPALAVSAADISVLNGMQAASSPEEALDMINEQLAAAGKNIAVGKMEYVTGGPEADRAGQTVYATDRQLQLPYKWIAGDERRDASGDLITQISFAPAMVANGAIPALAPINASFDTWNNVQCSNLDIQTLGPTIQLPSAILALGGVAGVPQADVNTVGFLPASLFEVVLGPGAGANVLGVTFTFLFIDPATGEPTDVNNDGRLDTALKEVWYNDGFLWSTDGSPGTDIETVALHENGHALELGHFGRVARTEANGKLHVSPRAVMNAFILGTLRSPLGTDNAAYCSNYDSWPN